jgi:hypothetical protein
MAAKQNKLSVAEQIQKKAITKQVVGGVNTNISLTKTEKEFYQRFVNLSVNEMPLPQGDGMIRISPFDDYFLFTLYDEVDGEDTPIDLSNVGTLYLNFIGDTDDIDIKNHTQVEEVDLSQGEVLFRITRSDSKKILALNNNNFYISTKMIDPNDGSTSDESVLYQGIWLAVDDANRVALTRQIEELRLEYSNDELTKELAELSKELKSTVIEQINRRAKDAIALSLKQQKKKQQIIAIKKRATVAQTKSKQIGFYTNAARNLQNFTIGRNSIGNRFRGFFDNGFTNNADRRRY